MRPLQVRATVLVHARGRCRLHVVECECHGVVEIEVAVDHVVANPARALFGFALRLLLGDDRAELTVLRGVLAQGVYPFLSLPVRPFSFEGVYLLSSLPVYGCGHPPQDSLTDLGGCPLAAATSHWPSPPTDPWIRLTRALPSYRMRLPGRNTYCRPGVSRRLPAYRLTPSAVKMNVFCSLA